MFIKSRLAYYPEIQLTERQKYFHQRKVICTRWQYCIVLKVISLLFSRDLVVMPAIENFPSDQAECWNSSKRIKAFFAQSVNI